MLRPQEQWGAASRQSWQKNGEGVLDRSKNSESPLFFAHVILTKTLCVCRTREIWARLMWWMDLWARGFNVGLVGDIEAEGATREGRDASVSEEEDEDLSRSYCTTVLSGKLRQAIHWETNREGEGCLLLNDQCTKTGRPVSEILQ